MTEEWYPAKSENWRQAFLAALTGFCTFRGLYTTDAPDIVRIAANVADHAEPVMRAAATARG